jgi:hypothetical protein
MLLEREPINSKWSTDVRFGAHSGLKSDITALPKSAKSGLMRRKKWHRKKFHYSITSSARPSSAGGGGLEIDGQLDFRNLLHREVSSFFALEDAACVNASLT